MEKHKIDWLNMPGYKGETWNPIIGCSKVSPACRECYALTMSIRLANIGSTSYYKNVVDGKKWNGKTHFVESAIKKPLHWKSPRMIFVCSMSDLFHEDNSYSDINKVFKIMPLCRQHKFIILTKRPERAFNYFKWLIEQAKEVGIDGPFLPLLHVCIGVTAENQEEADKRIPILLDIPSAKKFVSIEPMLGVIKLNQLIREEDGHAWVDDCLTGFKAHGTGGWHGNKLDWVICGGESGHNARPMHPDWVRSIRDQCKEANVPFFFKQWGELLPRCQIENTMIPRLNSVKFQSPNNPNKMNTYYKLGKSKTGSELDGQHHKEFPNFE